MTTTGFDALLQRAEEHIEKTIAPLADTDPQLHSDLGNIAALTDLLMQTVFRTQLDILQSAEGRREWLKAALEFNHNLNAISAKYSQGGEA